MAKKAKPVDATVLRRRMVLVAESDLQSIRDAFAAKQPVTVTVHPPEKQALTEAQRERRKAYRQRPEVREKQRAYRSERSKRLRAAVQALKTDAPQEQGA
jgi:hypothetical protein